MGIFMGAWGTAAWDNDAAADWFAEVFDATGLAKYVEEALDRDLDDYYEEIRAAAHVVVLLGRVYVWPIHDLDGHLELAISKLEAIKAMGIYEDAPEFEIEIDKDIETLRSRLQKPAASEEES
jgi:hypothetical protein